MSICLANQLNQLYLSCIANAAWCSLSRLALNKSSFIILFTSSSIILGFLKDGVTSAYKGHTGILRRDLLPAVDVSQSRNSRYCWTSTESLMTSSPTFKLLNIQARPPISSSLLIIILRSTSVNLNLRAKQSWLSASIAIVAIAENQSYSFTLLTLKSSIASHAVIASA